MMNPTLMTQIVLFQLVIAPTLAFHKEKPPVPKQPKPIVRVSPWPKCIELKIQGDQVIEVPIKDCEVPNENPADVLPKGDR